MANSVKSFRNTRRTLSSRKSTTGKAEIEDPELCSIVEIIG